jgi:ABC-type Fe3+-hydroxamate transport system substrate-binding protein
MVGGRNIYGGSIRYPSLSLEGIAQADPEVIIEMYPGMRLDAGRKAALASDWERLPGLAAVRGRRVHVLDDSYLAVPGPRAVEIARTLRACMMGATDPP